MNRSYASAATSKPIASNLRRRCYRDGMTRPALADAFGHHVWASMRMLDACRALTADQLASEVPGTYGSILDTARHLVGSDAWYIFTFTGDRADLIDEDHMDVDRAPRRHGGPRSGLGKAAGGNTRIRTPSSPRSTRTTATARTPRSASGSRRRSTTARTTAARSARR